MIRPIHHARSLRFRRYRQQYRLLLRARLGVPSDRSRPPLRLSPIIAALLFLLAIAAFGCATAGAVVPQPGNLPAAGLQRLYRVANELYRSAQPNAAQLRSLATDYGVTTILKLNSALEGHDEVPDGLELIDHPWLPAGPVTHDQVLDALDDLDRALENGATVLVHCEHGVDRTGLLVALYRVRHGSSPEAAWGEWRAYGRDENLILLSDAFKRETGYRGP